MAFDLTSKTSQFLDRHLVLPILESLLEKEIFPKDEINKVKLQLLEKTNMWDYTADIYKALNNQTEAPEAFSKSRSEVVATLKETTARLQRSLDEELYTELQKDGFDPQSLAQKELSSEAVNALYDLARVQFNCGDYKNASKYLACFRIKESGSERSVSALWGKYASEILQQRWDAAWDDMNRLREVIETKSSATPLALLQQRAWFIHWSLFVFFNHPNGRGAMVDLLLGEKSYLSAVQLLCPHILRYLVAAVVSNKKKKAQIKDLAQLIDQEQHSYKDPVTEFVHALYIKYDFEAAQEQLNKCQQVLSQDFFLTSICAEFLENARLFIFENYCRIHQTISISTLSAKLGMDAETAEKWIVNMIRNARLDAKIDSKEGTVVMGTQFPSVYQQVIEKTKSLSKRAYDLSSLSRRAAAES